MGEAVAGTTRLGGSVGDVTAGDELTRASSPADPTPAPPVSLPPPSPPSNLTNQRPMSYPPRHSTSSIASDIQVYSLPDPNSYSYGPQPSSTESLPDSPFLGSHSSHSRAPSILSLAGRRNRTRRASILGTEAFGKEYDDALAHSDDEAYDEEEGGGLERLEEDLGGGSGSGHRGRELGHAMGGGRGGYRQSFQPLTSDEVWWMAVSTVIVLALTVVSCVVTALG